MLDLISPLQLQRPALFQELDEAITLTVTEQPFASMLEVNIWDNTQLDAVTHLAQFTGNGSMVAPGLFVSNGQTGLVQVGPKRMFFVSETEIVTREKLALSPELGTVTDQSHARVRLRLGGIQATELLSHCLSCDLRSARFPVGTAVMTPLHEIPVLVHRRSAQGGNDEFDLYLPRSFAASLWHLLAEIARTMELTRA